MSVNLIAEKPVAETMTSDAHILVTQTESGDEEATLVRVPKADFIEQVATPIDDTLTQTGEAADAKATGDAIAATQAMNAAPYSTSATYAVGDYCTYGGKLYRCSTAISTAEAWTSGHWTEVKTTGEIADLKSAFYDSEQYALVKKWTPEDLTQGSWQQRAIVERSDRVCIKELYDVKAGDIIKISNNVDGLYYYFGVYVGSSTSQWGGTGGWVSELEKEYTLEYTGKLGLSFSKTDGQTSENIVPADVTLDIGVIAGELLKTVNHAVVYDRTQNLTDAQKTQARSNIAAADAQDIADLNTALNNNSYKFVKYGSGQALSDEDQALARTNIGAASRVDVRKLKQLIKFPGKRVSILGDSISTYDGWIPVADAHNLAHRARYISGTPWYTGTVDDTWWKKLIDDLDCVLGINDSWAGSKVSNQSATNTGDVGPDACMAGITRITNLGANGTPDFIFFYGGTNDAGTSVPIGTFDSTATYSLDLTTNIWSDFATAYKDAIMRLQYYYPYAKIIVMLPTYTSTYYTIANLDKYNEIIKDVCDYFGVDYVDMRRCGINYANLSTTLGDGVHPTVSGFAMMENYLKAQLFSFVSSDVDIDLDSYYSVVNDLGLNENTNSATVAWGGSTYTAVIIGGDISAVTVKMDGVDITSSAYNSSTGAINIPNVTGDIVITDNATLTMYTDTIINVGELLSSNVNGYGWCPNLDSDIKNKQINVVRFLSADASGTFEIGVVNALNGTSVSKVQSVSWTSVNKRNNLVTVKLSNPLVVEGTEMIVISPSTKPNYSFQYKTNVGAVHPFYTRVPFARDSGSSWGYAANSVLCHDFGYVAFS